MCSSTQKIQGSVHSKGITEHQLAYDNPDPHNKLAVRVLCGLNSHNNFHQPNFEKQYIYQPYISVFTEITI